MKHRLWCVIFVAVLLVGVKAPAQINAEHVMLMGRNALYYEDYVLAIQRFNRVIASKPYMAEAYFFRGLAKFYLEDYTGAEHDCSSTINLAPYEPRGYVLRGLCRVNLEQYEQATHDYERVIHLEPLDESAWHNLVLCRIELKQWERAVSALDSMIAQWPRNAENHCILAQVALETCDTIAAEQHLNDALRVNSFEPRAWSLLGMLSMQREEWERAEQCLDTAIIAQPRACDHFINRALVRYHRHNLRGALSDYDVALEIDDRNYLGHYNRALLRAQVGDDNRAIEDFNFVLEIEPDNDLALFNRALLLDNTGDYNAALADINTVLEHYPYFWDGYMMRAAIRRKVGDINGAEQDEFKVRQEMINVRYGGQRPNVSETRRQGSRNIDEYNRLVEADDAEPENEYTSEWRGRVQNRYVELQPLPAVSDEVLHEAADDEKAAFEAFNRGCTRLGEGDYEGAIGEFAMAIRLDITFPEAYYNRGVAYLLKGDKQRGLADLSQAGELGLYGAYNLIKRYSR